MCIADYTARPATKDYALTAKPTKSSAVHNARGITHKQYAEQELKRQIMKDYEKIVGAFMSFGGAFLCGANFVMLSPSAEYAAEVWKIPVLACISVVGIFLMLNSRKA